MTIEKVKQIACEKYGKELTDEQAATYANKYGKLSDNELDNISGGHDACDEEYWRNLQYCQPCGVKCDDETSFNGGVRFKCPVCGAIYS